MSEEIKTDLREVNLLEATLEKLKLYHTLVHIEWNKIKQGKDVYMGMEELWIFHKVLIHEMLTQGLKHISPVDELDNVELLSKYVQPRPSNDGRQDFIFLSDVLKYFGNFKVRDPMVYIVGGICNHGKTRGDIDILINVPEKEFYSTFAQVIKFRIARSFPPELRNRLHFLFNDGAGPFTSYVPIMNLECNIQSREVMEMSAMLQRVIDPKIKEQAKTSLKENRIEVMRFFKMAKPQHGVGEVELYNKENFLKHFNPELLPCQIDRKFDGMACQVHSKGKDKKIWSDDGGDITHRFPTFLSELPDGNYVILVEITGKMGKIDMPRSDVAGYAHGKGGTDDRAFTANCYDLLYLTADLHEKSLGIRREMLSENFKSKEHFAVVPYKMARNIKELWTAIERILALWDSEGAMIKSENAPYELDGQIRTWVKYVKEWQIKARIIQKEKVSETDAFNYLCVIEKNIPIGRTYNTNISAQIGDSLLISFVNLNHYTDPQTKEMWLNWWRPRVIEKTEGTATMEEAMKLAKESRSVFDIKPFPKRYKEILEDNSDLLKELQGITTTTSVPAGIRSIVAVKKKRNIESNIYLPPESLIKDVINYDPAKPNDEQLLDDHRIAHAWMAQIKRGIDFKYSSEQVRDLHNIIVEEMKKRGFEHKTDLQQMELAKEMRFAIRHHYRGQSEHADIAFERPENKVDAYVLDDLKASALKEPVLNLDQARKEDAKTGNFKIDYSTGTIPSEQKILVQSKYREDRVFTEDVEGISKPGGAGATRQFPGVFSVLDKGTYEEGIRKPYFYEYFIKGNSFKGRYIFRLLPRSGKWIEAGRTGTVWFFWKPEDQNPYILSTRAIQKKDFDTSKSWLPKEIAKEIPRELVWWSKGLSTEEAAEKIKEVRKLLLDRNIIKLEKNMFVLHRHWWKGQEVIRNLPVEHWDIRFSDGFEFSSLDRNPLVWKETINSILKKLHDIPKWVRIGNWDIKPGEEGNPNKEIEAHVETLDFGSYRIIDEVPGKKLIEFKGKKLKGRYNFVQTDPESNQWLITREDSLDQLNEVQIEEIFELSHEEISRSQVADELDVGKQTVYKYQKILGLI